MLQRSQHLDRVMQEFSELGYTVSTLRVQYELQKGGNEMLVIKNSGLT